MTADELKEVLDLIADRAPALRPHVSKLKVGEIEIDLRAAEPPAPSASELAREAALDKAIAARGAIPLDPLDDPAAYPGGVVPRFPRRPNKERDDDQDDDDE